MVCQAAAAAASYFIGCFSTGYYLVKWRTGRDIRESGSGGTGARNVSRALGRTGFLLTLLGDLVKGAAAVSIGAMLGGSSLMALIALIAAVVGHLWPVQLGFRGGKGIAPSLGGLLIYNPWLTCFYLAFALGGFALSRRMTLCGLFAYVILPPAAWYLKLPPAEIAGTAALACLVLFAHHSNISDEISRLRTGRTLEPKQNTSTTQ